MSETDMAVIKPEEEKLEPLRNITDDLRIRLLNRLYAKKRKELKEREKTRKPNFIKCNSHEKPPGNSFI
ncbi:SKP1 protein [Trifolium repens]|nr:SKP1 protein [Trifolium repens]KAK2433573.1 SKP1 protein [Trifolium repens]